MQIIHAPPCAALDWTHTHIHTHAGFTPMCKVLEPRVVMAFLNDLFTRFDRRLDEFGVYKVHRSERARRGASQDAGGDGRAARTNEWTCNYRTYG
jgi:hypothetical protein